MESELVYWCLGDELGGKPPSYNQLARDAKVGRTFAEKVVVDINTNGGIVLVERLTEECWEEKEKQVRRLCIALQDRGSSYNFEQRNQPRATAHTSLVSFIILKT